MSGIDPLCGVQMRATGEVASLAQRVPHALFWALASSGLRLATPQRVLILGADRPAARVLSQRLRDLAQEVLDEAALSDLAPRPLDVEHARRALGKLRAMCSFFRPDGQRSIWACRWSSGWSWRLPWCLHWPPSARRHRLCCRGP
jgi:hypothetical protein